MEKMLERFKNGQEELVKLRMAEKILDKKYEQFNDIQELDRQSKSRLTNEISILENLINKRDTELLINLEFEVISNIYNYEMIQDEFHRLWNQEVLIESIVRFLDELKF